MGEVRGVISLPPSPPFGEGSAGRPKKSFLLGEDLGEASYEKEYSIDNISRPVRIWVRITSGGICDTACGRNPSFAIDSVWRDFDILGVAHRD